MCAEYTARTAVQKIQERLGLPIGENQSIRFPERVKFTNAAPVVLANGRLTEKVFPANPFPNSRLSGVEDEDAGLDANIRRIYDVPLWKNSFAEHPVLVPMTSFYEPVYWGPQIGTVQKFSVPDDDLFFVAGMLIKPRVPPRPGLDGFTLLTHTATPQMMQYHQRLVCILKPDVAMGYLNPMTPSERFNYVLNHRFVGELAVEKERNMAKGWEKRIAQQEAKLRGEEAYRAALLREGTTG